MRTQPVLVSAALFGCFVGVVLSPVPARACSCLPTAIYSANPKDGAENVPRNQSLIVEGAYVPESIALEDSAGAAVEVSVSAGPTPGCSGTWAELVPKQPLAPNTKYTIRVRPTYTDPGFEPGRSTVTFTTGTDMLADEKLEPPSAKASVIVGAPDLGGCASTNAIACVGIADRKDVEMIARVGDRVLMRWQLPNDPHAELDFGFAEAPDCLEFRRRSATGQRSAPLTLCTAQLGTRGYTDSDKDGVWIGCHDGVFGAKASTVDAGRPSVTQGDSGLERLDMDESNAIPTPEPKSASAGANASEASPNGKPEVHSCSAALGERGPLQPWLVLSFASWLAAVGGKRTRRR